jgi:hypothetical protein
MHDPAVGPGEPAGLDRPERSRHELDLASDVRDQQVRGDRPVTRGNGIDWHETSLVKAISVRAA